MLAGALCVVLSNIFAGLSKAIWQLVLSQGVLLCVRAVLVVADRCSGLGSTLLQLAAAL